MGPLKLIELSKLTSPGTNLYENPHRYSDNSSYYAGPVPDRQGKGMVYEDLPAEVYLSDINLDRLGPARTMAHEGTHSKIISNELRKKKKPTTVPRELKEKVLKLMSSDPEFLNEYVGHDQELDYNDFSYDGLSYLTNDDELLARLNAMEAISPKGYRLEKSKYGKKLFGENNELLDAYLTGVIPEGYLRENKPFTETPNITRATPKSILESLTDWIKYK